MPITRIRPAELSSTPLFTPVVKAGGTVYVAGQVARNAAGESVGAGDIEQQAEQVFQNYSDGAERCWGRFRRPGAHYHLPD